MQVERGNYYFKLSK